MNFNTEVSKWNMPELNWCYGYPFALGMMALVAAGMLWWFKWRGWLRRHIHGGKTDEPKSELTNRAERSDAR